MDNHKIEAYQSYKTRARFPEITEKTLLAMQGIEDLFNRLLKLDDSVEELEKANVALTTLIDVTEELSMELTRLRADLIRFNNGRLTDGD
ncbi:MAG: hypothetical protein QNJ16_19140 [Rhodobacter sp.]|nr:hypothetical protein [Rhodobacter sp.]